MLRSKDTGKKLEYKRKDIGKKLEYKSKDIVKETMNIKVRIQERN